MYFVRNFWDVVYFPSLGAGKGWDAIQGVLLGYHKRETWLMDG